MYLFVREVTTVVSILKLPREETRHIQERKKVEMPF